MNTLGDLILLSFTEPCKETASTTGNDELKCFAKFLKSFSVITELKKLNGKKM